MKICRKRCHHCLFGRNAAVGPDAIRDHINYCLENDTHFLCHVPQLVGSNEELVCRGYFDEHSDPDSPLHGNGQLMRIMGRMRAFEFVDFPEGYTGREMSSHREIEAKSDY